MDHSVDLSIPDYKKVSKKEWTEAIKNSKILYKCITANTRVIWQHAAHTTDQLTSPNCKKRSYIKKTYLLIKNIEEFSGKSLEERASRQKKTRQKGYQD